MSLENAGTFPTAAGSGARLQSFQQVWLVALVVLFSFFMKGAPKQVENVASGSITPFSVPATLAV